MTNIPKFLKDSVSPSAKSAKKIESKLSGKLNHP